MQRFLFPAAFSLLALLALPAHAHKAHVHGEAQLEVVIDGDGVNLDLLMPLDAAVGFERAPRNEKEKAALLAAEQTLRDAASLWRPTPAAQCAPQSVEVRMPAFDASGHADVEARYRFRCANPAALKGIDTTLFKPFKRLYRIETRRIGPVGQGAQRLSPNRSTLAW